MSSSSSRQNGANQPPRRSVLQVEEAKRRVEERRQSEDPWEYVFQEEKLRAPSAEIRRVPMVPMVTVDNDGNVIEEPAVEEFIVRRRNREPPSSSNPAPGQSSRGRGFLSDRALALAQLLLPRADESNIDPSMYQYAVDDVRAPEPPGPIGLMPEEKKVGDDQEEDPRKKMKMASASSSLEEERCPICLRTSLEMKEPPYCCTGWTTDEGDNRCHIMCVSCLNEQIRANKDSELYRGVIKCPFCNGRLPGVHIDLQSAIMSPREEVAALLHSGSKFACSILSRATWGAMNLAVIVDRPDVADCILFLARRTDATACDRTLSSPRIPEMADFGPKFIKWLAMGSTTSLFTDACLYSVSTGDMGILQACAATGDIDCIHLFDAICSAHDVAGTTKIVCGWFSREARIQFIRKFLRAASSSSVVKNMLDIIGAVQHPRLLYEAVTDTRAMFLCWEWIKSTSDLNVKAFGYCFARRIHYIRGTIRSIEHWMNGIEPIAVESKAVLIDSFLFLDQADDALLRLVKPIESTNSAKVDISVHWRTSPLCSLHIPQLIEKGLGMQSILSMKGVSFISSKAAADPSAQAHQAKFDEKTGEWSHCRSPLIAIADKCIWDNRYQHSKTLKPRAASCTVSVPREQLFFAIYRMEKISMFFSIDEKECATALHLAVFETSASVISALLKVVYQKGKMLPFPPAQSCEFTFVRGYVILSNAGQKQP